MSKALLFVCAFVLTASVAPAAAIYSTSGTTTPTFFPVNGSSSTSSVYHAEQFTVPIGQGGTVGQLVVGGLADGAFTQTFYLRADASGSIGAILDTFSISTVAGSSGQLYTGVSTTNVALAAGSTYWLEAASPSGGNTFLWVESNPIAVGRFYSSAAGYFNGQPLMAFALLDMPVSSGVPEPGTNLLLLAGLAALAVARGVSARRQRAC